MTSKTDHSLLKKVENHILISENEEIGSRKESLSKNPSDPNLLLLKNIEDPTNLQTEIHKQYARRKRLVIIGAPTNINERQFVSELSNKLGLGIKEKDILKTFRIKARNIPANKSPPLNVEFRHVSDRNKLLDQNTRDKLEKLEENAKFYGVKCFPDHTYYQRKKYSVLKTERNKRSQCLINSSVI